MKQTNQAEKTRLRTRELVLIAVMVAMTVVGRIIFAELPHFKPVTAIVVMTGMYLGARAGFLTGMLSALISNFYFGQGPWTPFQMLIWGLIGFGAGICYRQLRKRKLLLYGYGVLAGALFSIVMDTAMALWMDGEIVKARWISFLVASLPILAIYVVSNVLFLWLLHEPFRRFFERMRIKYGIGIH